MNSYGNTYKPQQYSPAPGGLPQGFWASAGGAYTQTPQDNQKTSYQLNNLTSQSSPYMQQVASQAGAQAAGRGMGNSSYAMGNAQAAAIRAALPIASADAGLFASAAKQNQDALNQTQMSDRQNQTSITNANTAAGASMYGSDKSFQASKYGQDAQTGRQNSQNKYDAGQADINRQYGQSMLGLQDYYGAKDWARKTYSNILQGAYGTVYSDPANYSNPGAAMGFVNGFGNFADNQLNQYLYGNNPTGSTP